MAVVKVDLGEDIAHYVQSSMKRQKLSEAEVVADLVESGFEQKLNRLYRAYQEGEISLSAMAEQLGVTTWRAYHLLEDRGWRTANI
jgi:predicted HTH domain antitoxin